MTTYWQVGPVYLFRSKEEAERYCSVQPAHCTPLAPVQVAIDAEMEGCSKNSIGGWSVWSDGVLRSLVVCVPVEHTTTSIVTGEEVRYTSAELVPPPTNLLSDDARKFISGVRDSDSRNPPWLPLVRSVTVTKVVRSVTDKPGGFQGLELRHLTLGLRDGTTKQVVEASEGYSEGYLQEFFSSEKEALRVWSRLWWHDLACLECGAEYDKEGYVEPGQMGCDRCNSEASDWKRHLKS